MSFSKRFKNDIYDTLSDIDQLYSDILASDKTKILAKARSERIKKYVKINEYAEPKNKEE